MKIAVCEDEKIYSDKLLRLLEKYFEKRKEKVEITVFTDGIPLLDVYNGGKNFDLIFLDIQLEMTDGLDIAMKLREIDSRVALIFVTGFENRAVEGYSVKAFDYIVKSSMDSRLDDVLDRFIKTSEKGMISVTLTDGKLEIISCDDIVFIESDGRGTAVYFADSVVRTALSVNKVYQLLPRDLFIEIHKSVFANLMKIKRIGSDTVEMSTGKSLPMSRRKRKYVLSSVMSSVESRIK
ncbi:MAG: response regulator transcription factor [Ruminococcus sp.]|nr:response regulator transcription factor [Ruminococcus sp.]